MLFVVCVVVDVLALLTIFFDIFSCSRGCSSIFNMYHIPCFFSDHKSISTTQNNILTLVFLRSENDCFVWQLVKLISLNNAEIVMNKENQSSFFNMREKQNQHLVMFKKNKNKKTLFHFSRLKIDTSMALELAWLLWAAVCSWQKWKCLCATR